MGWVLVHAQGVESCGQQLSLSDSCLSIILFDILFIPLGQYLTDTHRHPHGTGDKHCSDRQRTSGS